MAEVAWYSDTSKKGAIINTLKQKAINDAFHDFKSIDRNLIGPVNNSMPGSTIFEGHEDEPSTLMSICKQENGREFNGDRPINKRQTMLTFDGGATSKIMKVIAPGVEHKYTIKRSNGDIRSATAKGRDLYVSLFGEDINDIFLVVDFAHFHIIEAFKEGTQGSDKSIHYLFTPENENDPGPKPVASQIGHTSGNNAGVNVLGHVQTEMKGFKSFIPYTKYDTTNLGDPLNLFFSNYTYKLSNLIPIKRAGKTSYSTTLTITNENGEVSTIHNSHQENSINNLNKYIQGFIARWMGTIRTKAFSITSKYKQKRSGDWFQALAALTATDRLFGGLNAALLKKERVYFMTHDQIALTYALLLGINCIFLNDKIAYSFSSKVETLDDQIEDWESIRKDLTGSSENEGKKIINFLKTHQTFRETQLEESEDIIVSDTTEQSITDITSAFKRLRDMFTAAITYCFINETMPDTSDLYTSLIREPAFTQVESSKITILQARIKKFKLLYATAKDLWKQHGAELHETFEPIITNLKERDIYILIEEFNEGLLNPSGASQTLKSIKKRLKEFTNKPQDKFAFLPYCSSLPTHLKERILEGVTILNSRIQSGEIGVGETRSPRLIIQRKNIWQGILDSVRIAYQEDISNKDELRINLSNKEVGIRDDEKVNRLEISEVVLENNIAISERRRDRDINDYKQEARGGGKKQRGGWKLSKPGEPRNTNLVYDIDIQQTSRPTLGAHLIYCDMDINRIYSFYKNGYIIGGAVGGAIGGLLGGLVRSLIARWTAEEADLSIKDRVASVGIGGIAGVVVGQTGVSKLGEVLMGSDTGIIYDTLQKEIRDYKKEHTVEPSSFEEFFQGGGNTPAEQSKLIEGLFHPLLPIYMLLDVFDDHMSTKCVGSSIYEDMIKYYIILKKCGELIIKAYQTNKAQAYYIGHTLFHVLFHLTSAPEGEQILSKLFDIELGDYKIYSSINNSIVSKTIGYGPLNDDQLFATLALPLSEVFLNFIKELDIKLILQNDVSNYTLESLKEECQNFTIQLGEQIIKDEQESFGLSSIFALKRGTAKQKNKNRKNLKNTLRKAKSTLLGAPLQGDTTQLEGNLAKAEANYLQAVEENKEISAEIGVPSYEETLADEVPKEKGIHSLANYKQPEVEGEVVYVSEKVKGGRRKTSKARKQKKRSSYKYKTAKKP